MAIEKVKEYFKQFGIENKILEPELSSATVELAARALGYKPKRIAKTLSFLVDEKPILVVCAGDVKVKSGKFKDYFHSKAKMIPPDKVLDYIGHDIGGVCPFAVNEGVEVYLDTSLMRFKTVFPACGSSNSAIELTIEELEKYSNKVRWVNVCEVIE